MEKTYQEQLKDLIAELITPLRDEIKQQKEISKEQITKALESNLELKAMVDKIANMPATKTSLVVPGTEKKVDVLYHGYNLKTQGRNLKFESDELRERYAKFLIGVIQKLPMEEGTAGEGGFLVPDEYAAGILALARLKSFALTECNVIPMSRDTLRLPAESTKPTVNWAAEEVANAESEPTVTEVVLQPVRLGAWAIASNEFLMDSQIDVVSWLTELFAEAIGQEIDNQVLNGATFDGVFAVCTGNDVIFGAGAGGSYADMVAADFSRAISQMATNRTANAKFVMHRQVFHYVRTLSQMNVGATNMNIPIFANPGAGVPGTIFEYPYILSDACPFTDNTASPFIAFGNWKNYLIANRLGDMSLAVDQFGLFTTFQTRFRTATRWHGKPKFVDSFTRMLTA